MSLSNDMAGKGDVLAGAVAGWWQRAAPLRRRGGVTTARRLLILIAAALVLSAVAAPAAGAAALPADDDLTLAAPAGSVLVGLTVRPAAPGERELLVHLEGSGGGPPAEERSVGLTVDDAEVPLERCGAACRRGEAVVTGGEQLAVRVGGEAGGTARFALPDLPLPEGDALLARATERMNALRSYRVAETLGPADPPVRSHYAIRAPDRLRVATDGGRVTVRIGDRIYRWRPDEQRWETSTGPTLTVPNHIWDEPGADPVAAHVIGRERTGGVDTRVVAFFLEVRDLPIWYRLWIDDAGLVRAAEMRTRGHFMTHRYHSFDEPVAIEPPYGPVSGAAVAVFGDPPQGWWQAAATTVRWFGFAGVLTAAGGAGFLAWVHDRRADDRAPLGRLVTAAALLAVVAGLVAVPLGAAADAGAATALTDAAAWGEQLDGAGLAELALRLAGLAGVVAALPRLWAHGAVRLAVTGALVALASLLPTGHSATADPRWLATVADFGHTAAAAGWLGGLMLLGATLRRRAAVDGEPAPVWLVVAFSQFALGCVLVVVLAGGALAWIHVGGVAALAGEVYGRVLLAKLVLVGTVIGVAAYNRWWLVPALPTDAPHAWRRLQRTVVVEIVGLVAVTAVTAALLTTSPPA